MTLHDDFRARIVRQEAPTYPVRLRLRHWHATRGMYFRRWTRLEPARLVPWEPQTRLSARRLRSALGDDSLPRSRLRVADQRCRQRCRVALAPRPRREHLPRPEAARAAPGSCL